jgi:hypothetical protein
MCLAVAVPKGKIGKIKRDEMHTAFSIMRDGAGFGYHSGGKARIKKGYIKFNDFWEDLQLTAQQFPESAYVIHFRMATHGKLDTDNMHPFQFKGGIMVHNGIISELGDAKGTGVSDTQHLAKLMHDLPSRAVPYFVRDLGSLIGMGNKVAILDNDGELHIANERAGLWDNEVWYSNSCYQAWENYRR